MNNYLIHRSMPHYHLGIHWVSSNVRLPCGKFWNNNHSLTATLWITLQVCGFCFLGYFCPPPNNWFTVIQYLEWHGATQWEWYVSTLQLKLSPKLFFLFLLALVWFCFGILRLSGSRSHLEDASSTTICPIIWFNIIVFVPHSPQATNQFLLFRLISCIILCIKHLTLRPLTGAL